MCGRYTTGTEIENIRFREIINEANEALGFEKLTARADGDVYPTDVAPALIDIGGAERATGMRWGFRGQTGLIINARSETALEKPMFADSARRRRCLIPATGFYEWDSKKAKYLCSVFDAELFFLAGLYRPGANALNEFVILTRDAYGDARDIHSRLPLIITDLKSWLFDARATSRILSGGGEVRLNIKRETPEQISLF